MSNLDDELRKAAMSDLDDYDYHSNQKASKQSSSISQNISPNLQTVYSTQNNHAQLAKSNTKTATKTVAAILIVLFVVVSGVIAGIFIHSNRNNVSESNYGQIVENGDEAEYYDASSLSVGDYLELGEYPKTQITDTRLITYLNDQNVNMNSYSVETVFGDGEPLTITYYFGDFEYEGIKYRRVYYEAIDDNNGEDVGARASSDKFESNTNYYFQWEPILWDIIGEVDGNWQLFAQNVIDGKPLDCHSNSWENSFCRQWITNTFINDAFTEEEKALIQMTDTSEANYSSQDQVYLFSYDDINNGYFGFLSDEHDPSRETVATEYGAFYAQWDAYDHLNNIENCEYCLRTIKDNSEEWGVNYYQISNSGEGYIDHINEKYMNSGNGFRPALRISKNAKLPI